MLWMTSSCMAVGGFNIQRTLAIEERCTLIVFTCLFSAKRWIRYSASVRYKRSLDCIPLSCAHLAKAFHWELYTWLDEFLRGSAAICTTVSGKWGCLRRSGEEPRSWIQQGLCGTEGGKGWGCTGIGLRLSAVCEDEGWAEVAEGATVETSVEKRWWSLLCCGKTWSFGGFLGLLELVGMHKLSLGHARIWRGRLPPKPCRPGKVKRKLGSPCSPRW